MKLKFRVTTFSGVGGWVGSVEELRIKPSQLSTKLKLKLKLSLAKNERKVGLKNPVLLVG